MPLDVENIGGGECIRTNLGAGLFAITSQAATVTFITTEAGDALITESSNSLVTESS